MAVVLCSIRSVFRKSKQRNNPSSSSTLTLYRPVLITTRKQITQFHNKSEQI